MNLPQIILIHDFHPMLVSLVLRLWHSQSDIHTHDSIGYSFEINIAIGLGSLLSRCCDCQFRIEVSLSERFNHIPQIHICGTMAQIVAGVMVQDLAHAIIISLGPVAHSLSCRCSHGRCSSGSGGTATLSRVHPLPSPLTVALHCPRHRGARMMLLQCPI